MHHFTGANERQPMNCTTGIGYPARSLILSNQQKKIEHSTAFRNQPISNETKPQPRTLPASPPNRASYIYVPQTTTPKKVVVNVLHLAAVLSLWLLMGLPLLSFENRGKNKQKNQQQINQLLHPLESKILGERRRLGAIRSTWENFVS